VIKQVFYVRTGKGVKILPTAVTLTLYEKPWPIADVWSLGAEAFERMREENGRDVEFVELDGGDSK
jgi:hypothetical protein